VLFAVAGAAPATGPDTLEHIRQLRRDSFLAHRLRVHRITQRSAATCSGRYLDIALDTALATRHLPEEARFHWTAETTVAVNEWWQAASSPGASKFLKAVHAGQLEVTALPLNATPYL